MCIDVPFDRNVRDAPIIISSLPCDFAKFWTPHFSFLDSTIFRLDSTFWLDSTLKLNSGKNENRLVSGEVMCKVFGCYFFGAPCNI